MGYCDRARWDDGPAPHPPLGVMPREVWEKLKNQQRKAELYAAMKRYADAEKPIPRAWIDELQSLEGSNA